MRLTANLVIALLSLLALMAIIDMIHPYNMLLEFLTADAFLVALCLLGNRRKWHN